ncbi:MAG: T9SS type A sorting domain-containing protein [Bacteroidota bacterium]
MKIKYIAILLSLVATGSTAQTLVTIKGGQVVQSGGYIVLDNAGLVNHGAFSTGVGEVIFSGDVSSEVGGSSATIFHKLTIDKGDAQLGLGQASTITNALYLTSGLLDIGDHDLTIAPGGRIAEYGEKEYIKTSGMGSLHQTVAAGVVDFPIGGLGYKPLVIHNQGAVDVFSARVEEKVYQKFESGVVQTQNAVDASWHISEGLAGGSRAQLSFRWNGKDELPGFDRQRCQVNHFDEGNHTASTVEAAQGSEVHWRTQPFVNSFGTFTISSEGTIQHHSATIQEVPNTQLAFHIFPNPTSDYVIIQNVRENEWGQLIGKSGQVLKEFQISSTPYELSLRQLPKGSYFVKIGTSALPLIVQ